MYLQQALVRKTDQELFFEGIQRWSESKGNMTVEQMKERIYSGIKKEMLYGVQAIRTHIDVTDPTLQVLRRHLK